MHYRVVQWATGNIGSRALREVIRHPELELVGVVVYDEAKNGVDAGELCGEPATGVLATTDPDKIFALDADCVVHMPRLPDVDNVVSLLESGKNVVSTRAEFFGRGEKLDELTLARVHSACERGRSSVFGTGSSPGFNTDSLPFALLSMQRRVEHIEVNEYANLSRRDSTALLFEIMGFGQPMGAADPGRAVHLLGEFKPALSLLARAAGLAIDEWSAHGELAAVRHTTTIAAGTLDVGTVGGQRNVLVGSVNGVEVMRFMFTWFCTDDLDEDWDLLPTGWRIRLRGDAPMDVDVTFPVALEEFPMVMPALTAIRPVNAIPHVCAAAPGWLTVADLPPITPAVLVRQ